MTRGPGPSGCRSRRWDTIRTALTAGPVLVQTPRSGYAASLACERCRTPARCTACSGPLRLSGSDRAADLRLVRA